MALEAGLAAGDAAAILALFAPNAQVKERVAVLAAGPEAVAAWVRDCLLPDVRLGPGTRRLSASAATWELRDALGCYWRARRQRGRRAPALRGRVGRAGVGGPCHTAPDGGRGVATVGFGTIRLYLRSLRLEDWRLEDWRLEDGLRLRSECRPLDTGDADHPAVPRLRQAHRPRPCGVPPGRAGSAARGRWPPMSAPALGSRRPAHPSAGRSRSGLLGPLRRLGGSPGLVLRFDGQTAIADDLAELLRRGVHFVGRGDADATAAGWARGAGRGSGSS